MRATAPLLNSRKSSSTPSLKRDAVLRHLGRDFQMLPRRDAPEHERRRGSLAFKRLPDTVDQVIRLPVEPVVAFGRLHVRDIRDRGRDLGRAGDHGAEPAGRAGPRADDDAAGGLILRPAAETQGVAGGEMGALAEEQGVDGGQSLPVVELRPCHRDALERVPTPYRVTQGGTGQRQGHGDEDAVDAPGVRVDGEQRLRVQVLGRIDDQSVGAECGDQVVLAEREGRQEGPLDELRTQAERQGGLERGEGALVGVVSVLVLRERPPPCARCRTGPGRAC